MTNAKHTPGPWRVEYEDNYIPDEWQEKPVQVVGAGGTIIACNTAFYPTALDPANASLIAAAPELLEALQSLKPIVEEIHAKWDEGMKAGKSLIALMDPSLKYRADITAIHAAIAKAEGR